jgi:predicted ATP-grasp superfamily ATP-dependent carboligase
MLTPGSRVLVAGVSARALAVSAARAGYRVTAIDAFGDVDLRAVATAVPLRRDAGSPFTARAAARAAREVDASAVAYSASFENYPETIAALAAGRWLLGNPPEVVRAVRQPVTLMRVLGQLGFAVPATRASAPLRTSGPSQRHQWLRKPRKSGGGHGTHPWRRRAAVARGAYLQERIVGVPGSITFVADGRRAVPLGLSRQLVGEPAFGARGFRYCGSLIGGSDAQLFKRGDEVSAVAAALADAVTAMFGLVGVNGIDFIARDGVAYPIEVNPRYSASMELFERAYGVSIFELHARACAGELPATAPWHRRTGTVHGKAIVFARRATRLDDTATWLDAWHADVPHSGERISRGHPICTVFATARDVGACIRTLVRRGAAVSAVARPTTSAIRGAA